MPSADQTCTQGSSSVLVASTVGIQLNAPSGSRNRRAAVIQKSLRICSSSECEALRLTTV